MDQPLAPECDRRRVRRLCGVELPDDVRGRIRPGHQVRIVDVSRRGALIDTAQRLLPGTHVEVHLEHADGRHVSRARVVRCGIAELGPQVVVYRAGLEFEREVNWLEPAGVGR